MRFGQFIALPLAVLLAGCFVTITSSRDIELKQSDEQQLVVTNASGQRLTIAAMSGPPRTVAPGGTIVIRFRVVTIGTLKTPSGTPYWTVEDFGFRERFVESQMPALVDSSSPALALHFLDERGAPVTATFALNLCGSNSWDKVQGAKANHSIAVPDPVPAVPQAVCPS